MNKYERRWKKVLEFARKIEKLLQEHPSYKLVYEDEIYDNMTFIIDEDAQRFSVRPFPDKYITYLVYYGNLNFDEGAYDTVQDTMNRLKSIFQIVEIKQIKI